jgi:Peptidase inhibitor family I36
MASTVNASTPASASSPQPRDVQHCYDQPASYFCWWPEPNYGGNQMGLSPAVDPGVCYDLTLAGYSGASYVNLSGRTQRVWQNPDCTGENRVIDHNWGDAQPPWPARGLGGYP